MDFDVVLETITPNRTTTLSIGSTGGIVAPSGTTAQRPGSPISGTLRYNTTTTLIEIYQNGVWINLGATAPASPTTSIQWNNAGVFGGSSALTFTTGANPYVTIQGTTATNQIRIGPAFTAPGLAAQYAAGATSTVYIETNGTDQDGQLVYFNNGGSAAVSGYIGYAYDTNAPYIRIVDADDDAPYITFNTIGTGTISNPLYVSAFGARGTNGSRTGGANSGFAWYVGANTNAAALITANTPVMTLDTQFLDLPGGTTANRPGTPAVGMIRYNTTLNRMETYEGVNWLTSSGVLDKSTTSTTFAAAGPNNIISYSVPANTLGTDGILKFSSNGYWNNASGAGRTCQVIVSYGGTTMWTDTTASVATATVLGWSIDLKLVANNSTGAQTLTGTVSFGPTGAPTTGTVGNFGTTFVGVAQLSGTAAYNSTTAGTFVVSVTFSGATNTFVKQFHLLEKL